MVDAGCAVGADLNRWLENSVRLRESTRCSYTQLCRNHLIPHLGQVPQRDLTGQQISGMLESVHRFSAASRRPVSDGTIARIYVTLRAALNAAVRQGSIEQNPARLVEESRAGTAANTSPRRGRRTVAM
jgi:hypothetical protein